MESSVEIVETTPKVKEKLSENVIWLLMYILSIIHGLMVIVPGI